MLTVYKPPRRSSEDSDSSAERILPGRPYLTKVNGQLVMARDKRPKQAKIAVDLLGEAFGVRTRVIRKRSKSLDRPKGPLLIGGVPYVPQQQLTYSTPIPQAAFSSQNLLPYIPHPAQSFVLPNPSQRDVDQLQQLQAHFNKMFPAGSPTHGHQGKVEVTKTTVTITKHICAGCGRIRSKKYHHDHPLKEGEKPEADFCRKCQKDSSSTGSGGRSSRGKKKDKKSKHKKHYKKHAKVSSDDESSDSPAPKSRAKPKHPPTKKEARRVSSEEYIIIETEVSEEEISRPRSRGRVRERVVEEYEVYGNPLPRRSRESSRQRFGSRGRDQTRQIPRKPVPPPKIRETVIHEILHRRPSIEYRYVEAAQNPRVVEERVEAYPKKVPVHFYDDIVHEAAPPHRDQYREHIAREREPSGREYSVEEAESISQGPLSRGYFDTPENVNSSRSEEARQRRRRERNSPISPVLKPWEAPHIIHPRNKDGVVLVTERFEYRPKKAKNSEEDRRRQEYVDRATFDARARADQFSPEEAARYYHDDWSRIEPEPVREPMRRRGHTEPSYRRERYRDEELSDSEASYEYRRTKRNNLPRAPTPPSPFNGANNIENWKNRPPYPMNSDSEAAQRQSWKGKASQRKPIDTPRDRGRSMSRARPAYVRETADVRTEKALIPSPIRSRERETERYVEEVSVSDMTERERMVEGEVRHVTFRNTPSLKSAQGSWTEGSEDTQWPVETERSGSGWNDGIEKPSGSGWNR